MPKIIKKVAIASGLLHFVLLLILLLRVEENTLTWLWVIYFAVDFPVSLVSTLGLDAMAYNWGEPLSSWPDWKSNTYTYWPAFVHLVLGSIWWYFIPILINKIFIFLNSLQMRQD